jgi:2-polyprenyl-3-methyl-5-hydroxy-6-metoxy-1,4-benzoquinol methylase
VATRSETANACEDDAAYRLPELVAVYDALNGSRPDFDFHLAAIGSARSRVLDIGCGTGTLAVALARLGHRVVAVDPSAPMIEAARRRPGGDLVSWHVGFCDSLPADGQFDRILMTGHAFQCLITDADIADLFGCVRARLAPRGCFVFETRNPAARAWKDWTPENAAAPVALETGGTVQQIHEVISHDGEVLTYRETFRFQPGAKEVVSVSRLRFADPQSIVRLASRSGLSVQAIYGDWDRSDSGPELIFEMSIGQVP